MKAEGSIELWKTEQKRGGDNKKLEKEQKREENREKS
jgi:hypothetical protein